MNRIDKIHIAVVIFTILTILIIIMGVCAYIKKKNTESYTYQPLRRIGLQLRNQARKLRRNKITTLIKNINNPEDEDMLIRNTMGKYKGLNGTRLYQDAGNQTRTANTGTD